MGEGCPADIPSDRLAVAAPTGARWRKPRPRHIGADLVAQRSFKDRLRPLLQQVAAAFPRSRLELWAVDEHRIGLKPLLHKVWALGDQCPVAPVEHRFAWRYLVGFVHPASGRTIFHVATSVSVALIEAEIEAFAAEVGASPRKEIVLVLDRAGWHTSVRLRVPEHVHLLFLPPYSPELQPAEHRLAAHQRGPRQQAFHLNRRAGEHPSGACCRTRSPS